jgi:hypothetical protein
MKTLEIDGMSELNSNESKSVSGGGFWAIWGPALAVGILISAIDNFGDIREGLADGWNGTPRH